MGGRALGALGPAHQAGNAVSTVDPLQGSLGARGPGWPARGSGAGHVVEK